MENQFSLVILWSFVYHLFFSVFIRGAPHTPFTSPPSQSPTINGTERETGSIDTAGGDWESNFLGCEAYWTPIWKSGRCNICWAGGKCTVRAGQVQWLKAQTEKAYNVGLNPSPPLTGRMTMNKTYHIFPCKIQYCHLKLLKQKLGVILCKGVTSWYWFFNLELEKSESSYTWGRHTHGKVW